MLAPLGETWQHQDEPRCATLRVEGRVQDRLELARGLFGASGSLGFGSQAGL